MILAIDFGITTTDIVLMQNCSIVKSFHIESGPTEMLNKAIKEQEIDFLSVKEIVVTGGKRDLKKVFGKPFTRINELNAIGFGAAFLSKLRNALVVSLGTGTCMVSFKEGEVEHVAGTGVGGGTIIGLSRHLLGEENIEKLKELALQGSAEKVNVSVGEAIGSGIGVAPATATASNFAKKGKASQADIALGIQKMVGETNAVLAVCAAKNSAQKNIVFTGKTTLFPAVRESITEILAYSGFSPVFPEKAPYATAIGAAAFHRNCFK